MSVSRKSLPWIVLLCLAEVLLIGGAWWGVNRQIAGMNRSVNDISELKDPSPFRVALMGHLGKIHLGLQGYLRSADVSLLDQVAQSRKDFQASLPEFAKQNPKLFPKIALEEIGRAFKVYDESITHTLEADARRLEIRGVLDQNFTRIIFLIDHNIKPLIRGDQAEGDERKETALNVENLSRAWQQNLVKAWDQPSHAATELTYENDSRGDSYLDRYSHMELIARERKILNEIQKLWHANSDLARESFAREQVVSESRAFMDTQHQEVMQGLNKFLPAMAPAELQKRRDGYVRSMRIHGVIACLLILLALAALRFTVFGVYHLWRGEPLWKPRPPVLKIPGYTPPVRETTLEMDLKGVVTQWSSAAEKLYEYRESEMRGKSISKLFESEEEITRLYRDLLDSPQTTFETTHKAKSGVFFRVKIEFRPVTDANGHATAIGLVCARK